jgi:hypothetical protein
VVEAVSAAHWPGPAAPWLRALFDKTVDLFEGRYPGYQACDLGFHDLTHTMEVTVAVARILDGYLRRRTVFRLHKRDYELAIAAALLHDTGYLKETGDDVGTGAKFTPIHVARGSRFAAFFLEGFPVTPEEVEIVQRLILWTGVGIDYDSLRFRDEIERLLGCALGTGDLLGQMAAPDYPDRIEALFVEFQEAAKAETATGRASESYAFASVDELLKKTRAFYDHYVVPVMENAYRGICHDLDFHYADGKNLYLTRVEENIRLIEERVAV